MTTCPTTSTRASSGAGTSSSFDASTIQEVRLVGGDACAFTQDGSGLKVTLPFFGRMTPRFRPKLASSQRSDLGYAVRITFTGPIPAPR